MHAFSLLGINESWCNVIYAQRPQTLQTHHRRGREFRQDQASATSVLTELTKKKQKKKQILHKTRQGWFASIKIAYLFTTAEDLTIHKCQRVHSEKYQAG